MSPSSPYQSLSQLDVPRFQLADVAEAIGRDAAVPKMWLVRGNIFLGDSDREAEGRGRVRLFTLRRVLQFALMNELVLLGISPSKAGIAAFAFTDRQPAVRTRADGKLEADRLPGLCFPEGETVLVASVGKNGDELQTTIANLRSPQDWPSVMPLGKQAAVVVRCNQIFDATVRALRLDRGTLA